MRRGIVLLCGLILLVCWGGMSAADYINLKAHDVTSDNGALSGFGSISLGGITRTEWGTLSYDNIVITGGTIDNTTITLIDNSVVPAKLRHTTTPDNTLFYRGDGEWGDPGVDVQTQLDAKQDESSNLIILSNPTIWRLFYSNGSSAITELPFGVDNLCLRSTGVSTAPVWEACGSGGVASLDNTTMDNTVIGDTTPAAGSFTTLSTSTISNTEFNYLDNVSSNIQDQFTGKASLVDPVFTNNITVDNVATAAQFATTCLASDNNCGLNIDNDGDAVNPTTGLIAYNKAVGALQRYNGASWDNVSTGSSTIADNSVAPIKLQSSAGDRTSDYYYRGDGAWGIPASGITVVDTAPVSPVEGDAWLLTTDSTLYIRGAAGTYSLSGFSYVADNTSGYSYTDSFNRANADPASGSWTTAGTAGNLQIIGNEMASRLSTDGVSRWSGGAFTDNQYSQITIKQIPTTGGDIGPCVQVQDNAATKGYCVDITNSTTASISRWDSLSTVVKLGADITGTFANTDVIRLDIDPSGNITLYQNSISIATRGPDTTYTGGYAGIYIGGSTPRADDWAGGDR